MLTSDFAIAGWLVWVGFRLGCCLILICFEDCGLILGCLSFGLFMLLGFILVMVYGCLFCVRLYFCCLGFGCLILFNFNVV